MITNKTLKNIISFSFATLIVKFTGIFKAFLLAKILEPSSYGVWITLTLIVSYSGIGHFGTLEAHQKQFPFHMGQRDLVAATMVENGVFTSIVLFSIVFFCAGSAFAFLFPKGFATDVQPLIEIVVIAASIGYFSQFYYQRFFVRQNFRCVSRIVVLRALSSSILLVGLSWVWGLTGLVFGLLINEIAICGYTIILSNFMYKKVGIIRNSAKLIKSLIQIGLPITVFWWFFVLQESLDRVISISMLGRTATGYYGLGLAIVSTVVLLPVAISRVLAPRVYEKVGENSNRKDLSLLVILPARALSLLLPLMIGILILVSPIVYLDLLPKYRPGLGSAQILLLGSFFVCVIATGVNFLVAIHKQNVLFKYVLISLATKGFCGFTMVSLGFNIEGIAISTAMSEALLALLVWTCVYKNMGYYGFDLWKEMLNLFLPFVILLGLIAGFRFFIPESLIQTDLLVLWYVFLFAALFSAITFYTPSLNKCIREIQRLAKSYI